jgi:hypothetical protein
MWVAALRFGKDGVSVAMANAPATSSRSRVSESASDVLSAVSDLGPNDISQDHDSLPVSTSASSANTRVVKLASLAEQGERRQTAAGGDGSASDKDSEAGHDDGDDGDDGEKELLGECGGCEEEADSDSAPEMEGRVSS